MRTALLVCLCAASALAQNRDLGLQTTKPIEVDFSKVLEMVNNPIHIHTIPANCKGKPDEVFARQGTTYYACLNGKEVCNQEKGVTIPYKLVEAFEAKIQGSQQRSAEIRENVAKAVERAQASRVPAMASAGKVARVSAAELAPGAAIAPISDEQLHSVPVGTSRAVLLEKLGDPQMKITGDVEYYTYLMESGHSVQFQLDDGKLTNVQ